MKLKVEKQFRDKVTGQLHKVNDVFSVDDERGAELLNHPMGLVSVSEEKPKKTAPKTKTASKKSKKSE